ncbi:NADH-quinone oxidoreductase subunit J [candidate division GN15 bacterium]|nr:NADH-quinone oxidoreductase subunit J [candidate division GN15 bacterium]
MNLDVVIFILTAVTAVVSAAMMIRQRNPVAAVMFMILSLLAQAVCYIQLGALFLGAILVLVYAGAVMVLFLFVIMLLNLRGSEDLGGPQRPMSSFAKYTFGVLLTVELLVIAWRVPLPAGGAGVVSGLSAEFGSVTTVAKLMFTEFVYPFELTGVLLLIAVVGAVLIARKGSSDDQPPPVVQAEPVVESKTEKQSE